MGSLRRGTALIVLSRSERTVRQANLLDACADAHVVADIEFLSVEKTRYGMRARGVPVRVPLRRRRNRRYQQKDRDRPDYFHRPTGFDGLLRIVSDTTRFDKPCNSIREQCDLAA